MEKSQEVKKATVVPCPSMEEFLSKPGPEIPDEEWETFLQEQRIAKIVPVSFTSVKELLDQVDTMPIVDVRDALKYFGLEDEGL